MDTTETMTGQATDPTPTGGLARAAAAIARIDACVRVLTRLLDGSHCSVSRPLDRAAIPPDPVGGLA